MADFSGQQFTINPVGQQAPMAPQGMATGKESTMSEDMLGLDMTGLQEIEGLTSEVYDLWSQTRNFVSQMQSVGIDPTRPDPTIPESYEANKIFMTAMANIKHKTNALKQGAKMQPAITTMQGQGLVNLQEGQSFANTYGQDIAAGMVSTRLPEDVSAVNDMMARKVQTPIDYKEQFDTATATKKKYNDLAAEAEAQGNTTQATQYREFSNAVQDPVMAIMRTGGNGGMSGWNVPAIESTFGTTILDVASKGTKALTALFGERATAGSIDYDPLTGIISFLEKEGVSGGSAQRRMLFMDLNNPDDVFLNEVKFSGVDDTDVNSMYRAWSPTKGGKIEYNGVEYNSFMEALDAVNAVPKEYRQLANEMTSTLTSKTKEGDEGVQQMLNIASGRLFLPQGVGPAKLNGHIVDSATLTDGGISLAVRGEDEPVPITSTEDINNFFRFNSKWLYTEDTKEVVKGMFKEKSDETVKTPRMITTPVGNLRVGSKTESVYKTPEEMINLVDNFFSYNISGGNQVPNATGQPATTTPAPATPTSGMIKVRHINGNVFEITQEQLNDPIFKKYIKEVIN